MLALNPSILISFYKDFDIGQSAQRTCLLGNTVGNQLNYVMQPLVVWHPLRFLKYRWQCGFAQRPLPEYRNHNPCRSHTWHHLVIDNERGRWGTRPGIKLRWPLPDCDGGRVAWRVGGQIGRWVGWWVGWSVCGRPGWSGVDRLLLICRKQATTNHKTPKHPHATIQSKYRCALSLRGHGGGFCTFLVV